MAPFPPTAIASSSSALIVASGASLHVYTSSGVTTTTPETVSDAKAHATALVRKVAISSDGALAVTAGDDKALRIWDIAAGKATPRSARIMHKRAAAISFTAANDVIVTDKVGDVYLYPLEPRAAPPAPQGFKLQADPGLNPDADFLLGHVSVVSQHVLAPGGKRIITADRDEHIRVSRFPLAYVIDKYLFGSEG
jgi:tRNA (guanine-N(7)-)-methyltransferase subunit TRM82